MDKVFYQIVVYYRDLPPYRCSLIHTSKRLAQTYYDEHQDQIIGSVGKGPEMNIDELVLDQTDYYEGKLPHFWIWIFPVEVDYMIMPAEGSIPLTVDILTIKINGEDEIDRLGAEQYQQVIEWCIKHDKTRKENYEH